MVGLPPAGEQKSDDDHDSVPDLVDDDLLSSGGEDLLLVVQQEESSSNGGRNWPRVEFYVARLIEFLSDIIVNTDSINNGLNLMLATTPDDVATTTRNDSQNQHLSY